MAELVGWLAGDYLLHLQSLQVHTDYRLEQKHTESL